MVADGFSERYGHLLFGSYDCVDRVVLNAYNTLSPGFGYGLTLFVLTSVAAGVAGGAIWLAAVRFAPGVTSGVLLPQFSALVRQWFRDAERGQSIRLVQRDRSVRQRDRAAGGWLTGADVEPVPAVILVMSRSRTQTSTGMVTTATMIAITR